MRAEGDSDGPITGINVTPLVDVVLVVLIIFMATAPMIARRAIRVEVPKVSQSSRAATDALAVALNGKHELTLSGKPTTLDELKNILSAAIAARPDQAVTLSADKALPYGDVAELLDAVRAAGIRKVGLEVRRK
ncbi:MAG: biopolymer transporter ExbD [Elusimicrobia bacterium CG11_big_fil_rev_8_21_14_0_20_64_6]|nr:MAG: biopolymer transporter ExbD [Elusimicrobia bacterium CG11_big_fil_rev_8_21_14_0_20_64_6]